MQENVNESSDKSWTGEGLRALVPWQPVLSLLDAGIHAVLSEGEPLYLKAKTLQCAPIHMHSSMPDLSEASPLKYKKDKHVFEMDR